MIIELLKNTATRITANSGTAFKLNTVDKTLFGANESFLFSASSFTNQLTVEFFQPVNIKNILMDFTADYVPTYTLSYTYGNEITDTTVFTEFEYFTYNVSNTVPDTDAVIAGYTSLTGRDLYLYQGYTFKCVKGKFFYNDVFYPTYTIIMLEKDTNKVSEHNVEELKQLIKNDLFGSMPNNYLTKRYVFTYGTEELPLFDGTPSAIRFDFVDGNEFVMNRLEVYSDVVVSGKEVDLSLLNDTFYQPKYFEDYKFFPSISKSFFDMLNFDKQRDS